MLHLLIEIPVQVTELIWFLKQVSPVILKKISSDFESLIHLMIFYSLISLHYRLYLLLVYSRGIQLHSEAESLYPLIVGLEASLSLQETNFRTLITVPIHWFSVISQHLKGKTWNLNYPYHSGFFRRWVQRKKAHHKYRLTKGRHINPVPSGKLLILASILVFYN